MNQKKIIGITGANGYIGSKLCNFLLNNGYKVKGLIRNEADGRKIQELGVDVYYGDICDKKLKTDFFDQLSVLIHTAAKLGNGSWNEFYETNVVGTEYLVDSCIKHSIKLFIHFSTIEVYGKFGNRMLSEDTELSLCGQNYSDSKILAEQMITKKLANSSVKYVIVRPGMVYGPHSYFWTERLYNMAKERHFLILDNGEGNVYPVYIDNLLKALNSIIKLSPETNEIYNLVDCSNITWRKWGEDYGKICNEKQPFMKKDVYLMKILNWYKEHILKKGYSKSVEVYIRKAQISNDKARKYLFDDTWLSYDEGMQKCESWIKNELENNGV